jgi:hypothetical protein
MEPAEAERIFLPAAREAAKAFPVEEPQLSLVTVSENVTFRLTDGRTGEDWVLRLHRPGYHSETELEAERTIESEGRLENLAELVGVARDFETVDEFLEQISLVADTDEIDEIATMAEAQRAERLAAAH